ncbi:hypothetical protein AB0M36_20985 [Actinoplanes sp. NPDC051346]|uniref:hypothetical protein n=1 Tax=Actinoplanes sp. NPDC051346 TaxID=3155048 RepID=UPI00343E792F
MIDTVPMMAERGWWLRWLRGRRGLVTWWVLISCTAVNGVAVGYGSLWFLNLSLSRGDYLISGGGYAAAAVVLMFAAVGAAGLRGPLSVVYGSLLLAVVLVALAVRSFMIAADYSPGASWDSPWDGAGGVLCLPWTWPLLLCGIVGAYRLISERDRHTD